MTYGYEIEPQADTAARLAVNVSIPKPLLLILTEYARALPIEAAHAVRTDNESILVYWVSGSSLVSIESRTKQPLEGGLQGQYVTQRRERSGRSAK
jgi:hypothetical protein